MITHREALSLEQNINIEVRIEKMVSERTVNTRYGQKKVADFEFSDNNGDKMKLTLWEDQINSVLIGKKYLIQNAHTNYFNGVTSLAIPKWGSITPLED